MSEDMGARPASEQVTQWKSCVCRLNRLNTPLSSEGPQSFFQDSAEIMTTVFKPWPYLCP